MNRTCSLTECDRATYARSWCRMHYQRWRRTGSPEGQQKTPIADRLWAKVVKGPTPSACWVWTGCLVSGYGQIQGDGKSRIYTHRLAYELLVGEIPADLVLDHICRNRACCNPDHLQAVDERTNILRGIAPAAVNARRTACTHGHPLEGDNVIVYDDGHRACRSCRARRHREYGLHRKSAA